MDFKPAVSLGPDPDPSWESRQRDWARKLGRIRLGVEPVEEQLAKYRRATVALTAVPLALGLIFLALFTAFRRPDIGALVAAVVVIPIAGFAWLDFALLRTRAHAYLREAREHEATGNGRPRS